MPEILEHLGLDYDFDSLSQLVVNSLELFNNDHIVEARIIIAVWKINSKVMDAEYPN